MRFSKNGFDTKNPNQLVTQTTLGYLIKPTLVILMAPSVALFWLDRISFLQFLFYTLLVPIGYICLAILINPRQLFFKLEREKKDDPDVTIGHIKNGAWGEYSFPSKITINWPLQDEELETSYCKTIIGIDHEYLHHILHLLEGKQASAGFDTLAGNLTDHCRWVGLNLTIEGDMRGFWNYIETVIRR